jgi:hypothetical protein
LKAEKYDMFIIDLYPDQEYLAAYLNIPTVIRIVEDPVDVLFDMRKPFHSSQSPLFRPCYTGMQLYDSVTDL